MPYLRPTVNQLSPLRAPDEPRALADRSARERTDDAAQRSRRFLRIVLVAVRAGTANRHRAEGGRTAHRRWT